MIKRTIAVAGRTLRPLLSMNRLLPAAHSAPFSLANSALLCSTRTGASVARRSTAKGSASMTSKRKTASIKPAKPRTTAKTTKGTKQNPASGKPTTRKSTASAAHNVSRRAKAVKARRAPKSKKGTSKKSRVSRYHLQTIKYNNRVRDIADLWKEQKAARPQ